MPKFAFYAIVKGRAPGIYKTWAECVQQTGGYSGAIFKGFKTREGALQFMQGAEEDGVPQAPRGAAGGAVFPKGWVMQFDGGARPNPGKGGCGAVLWKDGKVHAETSYAFAKCTNNYAEFCGLIMGLRLAVTAGVRNLLVRGDSLLVIEGMRGRWDIVEPELVTLLQRAQRIILKLPKYRLQHIYRELNSRADALATEALLSQ